jgi:hypothetical protein
MTEDQRRQKTTAINEAAISLDLAAGQQLYVKILSLQNWDGACRHCLRDTFYAWLIPAQVAQVEIARDRSGADQNQKGRRPIAPLHAQHLAHL